MEALLWALLGGVAYVAWMLCSILNELREHRRVATSYYTREERAKLAAKLDEDCEYFAAVEKSLDAKDKLKQALG